MLDKLGLKADKFDLHCHTPASDGAKELIDLLIDAEKEKLDIISFTDHDTLDIYEYLEDIDYTKWFSGKIIYGVEITVDVEGERLEVLAYNFNYKKLKRYKYFKRAYDKKYIQKQTDRLVKKARKLGFIFEPVYQTDCRRPSIWRPVYDGIINNKKQNLNLIKKYGIKDKKHFCRVLFSQKGQAFYIPASYAPTIDKISKFIHKCGGYCILAHPYNYGLKNIEKYLDEFREKKVIDGIECAHSSHTQTQIKHLVEYCEKYKLLKTAGSDFHGRERFYENGITNIKFGYLGGKGKIKPITSKLINYK